MPTTDPYEALGMFSYIKDIDYIDYYNHTMLVNTPSWSHLWGEISDMYRNKTVFTSILEHETKKAPHFFMNTVGMYVLNYRELIESGQSNNDQISLIPLPLFEKNGFGLNYDYYGLAGISSASRQTELSWKFIQFINSEELAKIKSTSVSFLPTRESLLPKSIHNLSVFYKHEAPVSKRSINRLPQHKLEQIEKLGESYFLSVINQQISVETALKNFETDGNNILKD